MTQAGLISQFHLSRKSAQVIGNLIVARTAKTDLSGTPLEKLKSFAAKLQKKARRKPLEENLLSFWRISRDEALAGWHYLSLLFHPELEGKTFQDEKEENAAREVCLGLGLALSTKRGTKPLSREKAKLLISQDIAYRYETATWGKILTERIDREDMLLGTSLNKIPPIILKTLQKPS